MALRDSTVLYIGSDKLALLGYWSPREGLCKLRAITVDGAELSVSL